MNLKPIGQAPGQTPAAQVKQDEHVQKKPTPMPRSAHTGGPLSINLAQVPTTVGKSTKADEPVESKPKGVVRGAAGKVWEDPTLADWNPSNPQALPSHI